MSDFRMHACIEPDGHEFRPAVWEEYQREMPGTLFTVKGQRARELYCIYCLLIVAPTGEAIGNDD